MTFCNDIRRYLYLVEYKKYPIICVLFLFWLQAFPNKVSAEYFDQALAWSSECFNTRSTYTCRTAIRVVEDFQLLAASKDKHRCQSNLLALEANLIMVSLNLSQRRRMYLQVIENVKKECEKAFYL